MLLENLGMKIESKLDLLLLDATRRAAMALTESRSPALEEFSLERTKAGWISHPESIQQDTTRHLVLIVWSFVLRRVGDHVHSWHLSDMVILAAKLWVFRTVWHLTPILDGVEPWETSIQFLTNSWDTTLRKQSNLG